MGRDEGPIEGPTGARGGCWGAMQTARRRQPRRARRRVRRAPGRADARGRRARVRRHRRPLPRAARRATAAASSSAAAADDALQQTFINAHASLTEPGGDAAAGAQAVAVPDRPQRGAEHRPRPAAGARARCPTTCSAADEPRGRRRAARVVRPFVGAIGALPDSQREVIVRHAFGGDSHEAIAADLGHERRRDPPARLPRPRHPARRRVGRVPHPPCRIVTARVGFRPGGRSDSPRAVSRPAPMGVDARALGPCRP